MSLTGRAQIISTKTPIQSLGKYERPSKSERGEEGGAALNCDDGAFHLDHVHNPLLNVITTSLPGYNVNKQKQHNIRLR